MKILMFGRGVISTQYGWALEQAGNEVVFYVRKGRSIQYGNRVNLEILDGRKSLNGEKIVQPWDITMCEEIPTNHDFDLIIVSVNHNQLKSAVSVIKPVVGNATVLIFNNIWQEPKDETNGLPQDQLVFGFPGGGGGFIGNTLKGGFLKSVMLEPNKSKRHDSVYSLFKNTGFKTSTKKDFRNWLWIHFMLNAGLGAVALDVGGYNVMYNSSKHLKDAFLLSKEMIPLLKAKGGSLNISYSILFSLPAGLVGYIMHMVMSKENIASALINNLEETGHASYDLTSEYPRDVLADARRLNVPLPNLEALEPSFI